MWYYTTVQGDTQITTLKGGVVKDLDRTKEVLVKKSHKSETHSDFPGCLKKRRFSPANLCVRAFPRASPGWECSDPPPLPPDPNPAVTFDLLKNRKSLLPGHRIDV